MIDDYVAATVDATRALGVKCINAGGVGAFKENVRTFSLDDVVPSYGVSSRQIVKTLQTAVEPARHSASAACALNNLGARRQCRDGARDHRRGRRACRCISRICSSTATAPRARAASRRPPRASPRRSTPKEVTIDVGQVMFGADRDHLLRRACGSSTACPARSPKKGVIFDGDGNGGGIVPYAYRDSNLLQRRAMGDRAGAVPADRRSRGGCSSPPTTPTARPSPPIRSCSRC